MTTSVLPGPLDVVQNALLRVPLSVVAVNVEMSLIRILWGFGLGVTLGVIIGVLGSWYPRLQRFALPIIEILRPIPPLAWIPLAIVWFGLGERSKVFVIFLGAFFPVFTSALQAMTSIDPELLLACQIFGVRGWRLLLRVALPASLPQIATGIRVGWSLSFGALVAAELIAADKGLGFMIMNARELGQISVIIYGIVLIGALNLATDALIGGLVFRRALRWSYKTEAS